MSGNSRGSNEKEEQLSKIAGKHGFVIEEKDIDNVVHCKDGAANALIIAVYKFLTGKE